MSQAGTKLKKFEPAQVNEAVGALPVNPGAVMSDFEQICVTLSATGALIAIRDLAGVRCTVSFGTAPAVGSRLPSDFLFLKLCVETGDVALCEDADIDPAMHPSAAKILDFRSAVAVPIHAQGSVVGLIEVFSPRPCAIGPAVIDGLKSIAKSFASLMIFDAAGGGQPIVGGPLTEPVVLPRLESVPEDAAIPGTTVVETASAATSVAERARNSQTTAKVAALSQLPSDRPTPRRVWIIAGVFLLALALLLLFLFRDSHRESEDTSTESANPRAPMQTNAGAIGRPGQASVENSAECS